MKRMFFALMFGASAIAFAHHPEPSGVKVIRLAQQQIIEKLDGKDATVTVEEVTLDPGQEAAPHRHAGPVFGYVLEGVYEHALNDDRAKTYRAGETFYEPSGCIHRVTKNPGKTKTRLLAMIVHPRDRTEVTVPAAAQ